MIDAVREKDICEDFDQSIDLGYVRNPSTEEPIKYRGWEIYKWTGWKGGRWVCSAENAKWLKDKRQGCAECGNPVLEGQVITEYANMNHVWHHECGPDGNRLYGQWVAHHSNERFVYSATPGSFKSFQRGGTFEVERRPEQEVVTWWTPKSVRNKAREAAFERLKQLIDDFEDGKLPWPSYWGEKP